MGRISFTTKSGKKVSFTAKGKGNSPEKRRKPTMAKRKKSSTASAKPKGQGVVSWLTSVIALGMAVANPISRMAEAMNPYSSLSSGDRWAYFCQKMIEDYTGFKVTMSAKIQGDNSFDLTRVARGYAPLAGAFIFKKATSYALKNVKMPALIPRLSLR